MGDLHGETRSATAWLEYESGRMQAQVAVARGLCAANPGKAKVWKPLIDRAEASVAAALAAGGRESVRKAVRDAERTLAPLGSEAKKFTVHLVGHAHIDMNWVWSWPETVAIVNDSLTTAVKLLDEYPAFTFSQSQASIYRIVEDHNPALLKKIAGLVKAGRWEVTASHWVEADKNMPSGESLCRQVLHAKRAMGRMFGLKPDDLPVDWSPDTFGHSAMVPAYLGRSGIKYLYLHRPGFLGPKRRNAFWWKSPDGSRVLVYNDEKLGYNGIVTSDIGRLALEFHADSGSKDMIFVYGVGDHGGGPTRFDIERALDLAAWPVYPQIRFSAARTFFESLESQAGKLPTLTGELNTEFSGCYTSQSLIKRTNRFAENRLFDAELAASVGGREYPQDAFNRSWERVLFAQFHDILPGSGIHDTRTHAHGAYQEVVATAAMAETNALRALADRIDTRTKSDDKRAAKPDLPPGVAPASLGGGAGMWTRDGKLSTAELANDGPTRPLMIWNATGWERTEVVEAVLWFNRKPENTTFSVRTPEGKEIPAQTVRAGNEWWGHEFVVVAFPVTVPAFGYGLYTVFEGTANDSATGKPVRLLEPRHATAYSTVERPEYGIENGLVRIRIDPESGGIASLVDLRTGAELIGAEPVGLRFGMERHHGMSSWTVGHTGAWEKPRVVSLGGAEGGPERASVRVEFAHRESRFTLTYRLFRNDPSVHVEWEAVWLEVGDQAKGVPVLRYTIPLALEKTKAKYEIPLGAIDRPQAAHEEVPALEWACVIGKSKNGQPAGLILANDCKHGHALDGNTLHLSLLRSSYDPDPLPELGRHEAKLTLTPVSGTPTASSVTRISRKLNHPLKVVGTGIHGGKLGGSESLVSVAGAGVIVSAVKRAEDGDGLIIRLYEIDGRNSNGMIRLDPESVGIPADVRETDVLERNIKSSSARLKDGRVAVRVPAHGLVTLRIRFSRR